jgi:PAS domain S-box-containing protein
VVRRATIDGQDGAPAEPDGGAGAVPAAPAWFRAFADTSLVLIGVCAADGTFLGANRRALDGCGFRVEEQVGRPYWDTGWFAGSAEVRDRVRGWCEQVTAGGPPVRALTSYFLADGTERLVDFTLQVVTDADGRRWLLPNGMDVTDRVAAERRAAEAEGLRQVADARAADLAALRAAEGRLNRALQQSARILDNVADGLYGLDVAGRVQFANPAAARITGHPQEELLGTDQHALVHARRPDGSPYPVEECPVWRALRSGRTVTADDEVFWHADGHPVPVEIIAVPTVEDGAVSGVVVSFRDLTDRLAAQRQAAELARVREQAAAQRALSDRLQAALLTPPPAHPELEVAVRYHPAVHDAHVGGDWYDAFLQPGGELVVVIGDVVGHDSRAAATMGQLRGLLRAIAYGDEGPLGAVLTRVEHAARGLGVAAMATALVARLCPLGSGAHELRWSSAGHLPPVLLAPDGTSRVLATAPDLLLGVQPDARRAEHRAVLPAGRTLLLFTDGLVERRRADLDAGTERLRAAVADLGRAPLEELCDTVLSRLVPGAGEDDVALLAVRARDAA